MYSAIKSCKKVLHFNQPSKVSFCLYLSNRLMMFLLNSNKYLLVPHNDKDLIRIEGDLGFTEKVVECKRIEQNRCCVVTRSGKVYLCGLGEDINTFTMEIEHGLTGLFGQFQENVISEVNVFNNYDFCIKHHIFGKGITNNEIFLSWFSKFENGNSYHNEITQLPNVTEFFIIKPMVISNSIACFPQGQIREVLWEIGFVKKGLEEGRRLTLSLEGFNEEFIVLDICERAIGQYLLFTMDLYSQVRSIYVCRLQFLNDIPIQSITKQLILQPSLGNFVELIDVDYTARLLILRMSSPVFYNNQLYDNSLTLLDMDTGRLVEQGYCTLREMSISPNHRYIVDYSPQLQHDDEFIYQVRVLLDKRNLYLFMLRQLEMETIGSDMFKETVLMLLTE